MVKEAPLLGTPADRSGGAAALHPILSHPGIGKEDPGGRRSPAQPFKGEQRGSNARGAGSYGMIGTSNIIRASARPGVCVCVCVCVCGGVWGLGVGRECCLMMLEQWVGTSSQDRYLVWLP